jgi:hypothetical protein
VFCYKEAIVTIVKKVNVTSKFFAFHFQSVVYVAGVCVQVAGDYDVIVNCPGAWAGELVNDKEIAPLKGQLIKVITLTISFHF